MVNNFAGAFPGGGFGPADMAALGLALGPNAMGPGTGFGGTPAGSQASPGQQAAAGLGMGASGPSASFGPGFGFGGPSYGGGFSGGFSGGEGVGGKGDFVGFSGPGYQAGHGQSTHFQSPPNPFAASTHFKGQQSTPPINDSAVVDPKSINRAAKSDPISPSVMFPGQQPQVARVGPTPMSPVGPSERLSPTPPWLSQSPATYEMFDNPPATPAPTGAPPASTNEWGSLIDALASGARGIDGIMRGENQRGRFQGGRYDGGGGGVNNALLAQVLMGPPGGGR